MSKKRRTIEVVKVTQLEGTANFEETLQQLSDNYSGITGSFKIKINDQGDFITGSVGKIKTDGIPPKANRRTDEQSSLGLNDDEGLAYSNVFLYVKSHKVLYYEFNKNGCYLSSFSRLITSQYSSLFSSQVNFQFAILLTPQAYQRALRIEKYRSLSLKIANPKAILNDYLQENDFMGSTLDVSSGLNADTLEITYKMTGTKIEGMPSEKITQILEWVKGVLSRMNVNYKGTIEKCKLVGYYQDPEENKQIRSDIDLIFDKYIKYIYVEEPKVYVNTQIAEKTRLIVELYYKFKAELDQIIDA